MEKAIAATATRATKAVLTPAIPVISLTWMSKKEKRQPAKEASLLIQAPRAIKHLTGRPGCINLYGCR